MKPNGILYETEKLIILGCLQECGGNKTEAAKMLGITTRSIRNKLKKYAQEGEKMFISAKLKVHNEGDVVYLTAKLPKVMGKHELRMALRTPIEVNGLINDLVKAKNLAFENGAAEHRRNMEDLR